MTRKKLLYIGACIALAVLLVGVALYFVTWTTDVEINSWNKVKADGFDFSGVRMKLTLRKHNYIFRPAEYEIVDFEGLDREDGFTLSLPEGCRAVSQHDDPSYVITKGYFKGNLADESTECYYAFDIEKGLFISNYANPNPTFYLIGRAEKSLDTAQVMDYFSDFVENGCMPPPSNDSVINLNGTEASLNILNWAVVSADGEVIEMPDMKLKLRVQDYLSENPELEVLSFYVPKESRYKFNLYDGNPVGVHNPNSPYRVYKGVWRDTDSGESETCQYSLSVENGYILTKYADTGNYLIGSAKADCYVKEILKFFSKYTGE